MIPVLPPESLLGTTYQATSQMQTGGCDFILLKVIFLLTKMFLVYMMELNISVFHSFPKRTVDIPPSKQAFEPINIMKSDL